MAEDRVYHFHLVSDASGETIRSVARACLVQFEDITKVEHNWTLVRSRRQIAEIVRAIEDHPGMVLFTVVDGSIRDHLQRECRRLGVPCISILDPVIDALRTHLGTESKARPGRQHQLDDNYFHRIEAMDFALATDDGQRETQMEKADVIVVGVSRTSKTPTCIYLANQGIKAANVPYVPGRPLPENLVAIRGPLIVGLTKDPGRLVQIRRNRLRMLKETTETDYVDPELVKREVREAHRFYSDHGWPIIDVTRRSIEETAAAIMRLLARRQEEEEAAHEGGLGALDSDPSSGEVEAT